MKLENKIIWSNIPFAEEIFCFIESKLSKYVIYNIQKGRRVARKSRMERVRNNAIGDIMENMVVKVIEQRRSLLRSSEENERR